MKPRTFTIIGIVIVHSVLTLISMFMILNGGLMLDANEIQPTQLQETFSSIGSILTKALMLPGLLLIKLIPQLRVVPWIDWPLVLSSGILYALLITWYSDRRKSRNVSRVS